MKRSYSFVAFNIAVSLLSLIVFAIAQSYRLYGFSSSFVYIHIGYFLLLVLLHEIIYTITLRSVFITKLIAVIVSFLSIIVFYVTFKLKVIFTLAGLKVALSNLGQTFNYINILDIITMAGLMALFYFVIRHMHIDKDKIVPTKVKMIVGGVALVGYLVISFLFQSASLKQITNEVAKSPVADINVRTLTSLSSSLFTYYAPFSIIRAIPGAIMGEKIDIKK